MDSRHALADIAALFGVPARAAMLTALLDGAALPSGELARYAGLSAAAASLNLGKLVQGGLLKVVPAGRSRLYSLAGPQVAHALEALGAMATRENPRPGLTAEQRRLRQARCCYDHLAGVIAVELVSFWRREQLLRGMAVTTRGRAWFRAHLDIDFDALEEKRRPLTAGCMDWTERREHLSGALGAAVLETMLHRRWLSRGETRRALRITVSGARRLAAWGLAPP